MGREEKTALESALALHGEAFMSMFDDHVISEGRRGEQRRSTRRREEWDAHPIHDDDTMHASTAKKKKESSSSNRGKDLMMEDKEEFKKLSREIQHFGASGLDKKSRAKFEEKH
eukprot:jgi/Picre1/33280/NNA_008604.t1